MYLPHHVKVIMEENTYRYCKCVSNYRKELKSRSLRLPPILLLIYNLQTAFCFVLMSNIGNSFTFFDSQCVLESHNDYSSTNTLIMKGLYFLIPFCGWLSDTKIGRGNAIYLSLWLGWIGTLLQSVGCCLQYNTCGNHHLYFKKICISQSSSWPVICLVSISVNYSNSLWYRSVDK